MAIINTENILKCEYEDLATTNIKVNVGVARGCGVNFQMSLNQLGVSASFGNIPIIVLMSNFIPIDIDDLKLVTYDTFIFHLKFSNSVSTTEIMLDNTNKSYFFKCVSVSLNSSVNVTYENINVSSSGAIFVEGKITMKLKQDGGSEEIVYDTNSLPNECSLTVPSTNTRTLQAILREICNGDMTIDDYYVYMAAGDPVPNKVISLPNLRTFKENCDNTYMKKAVIKSFTYQWSGSIPANQGQYISITTLPTNAIIQSFQIAADVVSGQPYLLDNNWYVYVYNTSTSEIQDLSFIIKYYEV